MEIMTKAHFENEVYITPHAADKAMELFGFTSRLEARRFIRNSLNKATYISDIENEEGKKDRLFAYRRTAFVLDRTQDTVITIYIRDNVDKELREKVRDLLCDHIKELHKQEEELEEELLSLEIERSLLEELKKIDESLVRDEELYFLDKYVIRKREELADFKLERSKVVKGAVAFL